MAWYKSREFCQTITFIIAIIILVTYFFDIPGGGEVASHLQAFGTIVSAFALMVGVLNLFQIHLPNLMRKGRYWYTSLIVCASIILWASIAICLGSEHPISRTLYMAVNYPLGGTAYSFTAFYITSAAYRAFRARNIDSFILLTIGTLVILYNTPIANAVFPIFGDIGDWIFAVPNKAGFRGVVIGIALGSIAVGLRTLLGMERGYLRGGG